MPHVTDRSRRVCAYICAAPRGASTAGRHEGAGGRTGVESNPSHSQRGPPPSPPPPSYPCRYLSLPPSRPRTPRTHRAHSRALPTPSIARPSSSPCFCQPLTPSASSRRIGRSPTAERSYSSTMLLASATIGYDLFGAPSLPASPCRAVRLASAVELRRGRVGPRGPAVPPADPARGLPSPPPPGALGLRLGIAAHPPHCLCFAD